MKYRDINKKKRWSNHKIKKENGSLINQKLWFYQGDIRWFFFVNQWIKSGKKYVIERVIRKSMKWIRSEYLLSPWLIYRSALWGSRMLLDLKTKKFGRKQIHFPVVVKGWTIYSKPMLYLRKLMNAQKMIGFFWMRWNHGIVSTSIGYGPLFSTLENKYIQLAKLQNIRVKRTPIVEEGSTEWKNRFII